MATVKRDQILQEAEKLASRGKLDAAVKEYRRALEQAPNDTNTLNRLGDLLVRLDRVAEAIDVYGRIAEHFGEDGFFLKSIAIYKKINRLDPQRTQVYEKLADLYFKQGLVVEGRQQLLTLADWFLRSKQPAEAVRVFRRLGELEPSNLQARAKLVDLLTQLGDIRQVKEEINSLGHSLLARAMLDEAVKLYHRALELKVADGDLIAPCVDALVAGGRTLQAVELARRALAATSGSVELKRAAARALTEAGDLRAAREVLEQVLPEAGERTDVVQLYGDLMLRVGESQEAKEHLLPAVDRLYKAHDTARAGALLKRLLKSVPGDVEVLEKALAVFDRRTDPDMVSGIEASLADACFRSGKTDRAAELYGRLSANDPNNLLFQQRLSALSEPSVAPPAAPPQGEPPPAVSAPALEIVEFDLGDDQGIVASTPSGITPGKLPYAPLQVPSAVDMLFAAPELEAVTAAQPQAEEPLTGTNAEELLTEAVVFAKYGLAEKAVAHLRRLLALDPTHEEGRSLLASLGGGELKVVESEAPAAVSQVPVPSVAPPSADFSEVAPEPAAPPPPPAARPVPPPAPTMLAAHDEAKPHVAPAPSARVPSGRVRLEDLEAMIGLRQTASPSRPRAPVDEEGLAIQPAAFSAPDIAFRFESVLEPTVASAKTAAPAAVSVPPSAPEVEAAVELVEIDEVLAGPDERQLREVDFFIQQGLLDEAARLLAKVQEHFPNHPEVNTRQALLKARGWQEGPAPAREGSAAELFSEEEQFFDLAAELEQELADEDLVAEARGTAEGHEASIEELFKEFQRGVAEQLSAEDFDTHFNLGIAYREMGLLDEAIGEFQIAAKAPGLSLESTAMIAACYLDKGLFDQAIEWYGRALRDPSITPEAELGLKYELGRVFELSGNSHQALASFAEVLAVNPGFRDVVQRVARLQTN